MNSNKKHNQNFKSDSFFEAFRELGKDTAQTTKDTLTGIAGDMFQQIMPGRQSFSGELKTDQPFDFEAELRLREKEAHRKARAHFEHLRRQEKMIFSRKEEEIKVQIQVIQEELKKIINEAGDLAQEVEIAVEQAVVDPGVYHLNFFDKLRQLLILLRKKVADSHTWMHMVNTRAKSRNYFWGQVGKSGTKFLLSQERYMSTQAG